MVDAESFIDQARALMERGAGPGDGASQDYIDELEGMLKSALELLAPRQSKDDTPYEAILAIYHMRCARMPKVIKLSDRRRRSVRKRWQEAGQNTLSFWHKYFERAGKSEFLNGAPNGWRADFEWLINPANLLKVLEGRYDHKSSAPRRDPEGMQREFLDNVRHEQQQRMTR